MLKIIKNQFRFQFPPSAVRRKSNFCFIYSKHLFDPFSKRLNFHLKPEPVFSNLLQFFKIFKILWSFTCICWSGYWNAFELEVFISLRWIFDLFLFGANPDIFLYFFWKVSTLAAASKFSFNVSSYERGIRQNLLKGMVFFCALKSISLKLLISLNLYLFERFIFETIIECYKF